MSKPTYISAGSATLVVSGPGSLYSVWVAPAAGASVVVADTLNAGATGFDFNGTPTGLIWRTPAYSGVSQDFLDFKGVHFDNGLTIAASSSARVTAFTG